MPESRGAKNECQSSRQFWEMSGRRALITRYPRMVRNRTIDVNFHMFRFEWFQMFGLGKGH